MSRLSKEYVSTSEEENEGATVEFAPPAGYVRCKHLKKFHKKKSDEQLWLIKVPSSLDISKLKKLPIDFSGKENGEAAITSEGKSYTVNMDVTQREEQDSSNLTLLVPDESRDSLRVGGDKSKSWGFDRVFSVSEAAAVPRIEYEELRVPRSDVVKVEGLQVRHFASGYDEKEKSKKRGATDSSAAPSKKHKKKDKKKSKIK
ncbi:hypothetical protein HG536_0F00850 [Torulaspora globosa]|uniref:DNA-directed RNA polymerase I subunit RPA34 n=1 Tax=Torulaspora globosa TaxID=48254 RepID=A0A7G3ZJS4_9SACH|nr:uncharacterized protein HG536_0F00850 [Torulaspora globosa]QLL33760.1 hypothetical protein HG536_0F00850 [Torulaspora globosa]